MQAVTIREAKARLNALVEAAQRGEQIVLMRGATHVAAIVALSADDLEIAPRLSDGQAERLWRELATERANGKTVVHADAAAAVASLRRPSARGAARRRPDARSTRKR
jgi:antitoxin (DNA-binding transcriptional repressor) of toxin-antitoxin stability system